MTIQFKQKTGGRGIEWTDETRNAIGGCKHACRWRLRNGVVVRCYAEELAEAGVAKAGYPHGFTHHYWRSEELKALSAGREPRLIFPDSMSDLFGSYVPAEQVDAILAAMRNAPQHAYQSLTKAAPQVLKYVNDLPPNLWVGASSPPDFFMGRELNREQQAAMLRRALKVLREVKERAGNIVWMSAEPLSWDITSVLDDGHPLDWIVIGAASCGKQTFQPEPAHVKALLEVMDRTRTPVFYKGNIKGTFTDNDLGSAELNRWREDFPMAYRDGSPIPAVERRQRLCAEHGWTPSRRVPLAVV